MDSLKTLETLVDGICIAEYQLITLNPNQKPKTPKVDLLRILRRLGDEYKTRGEQRLETRLLEKAMHYYTMILSIEFEDQGAIVQIVSVCTLLAYLTQSKPSESIGYLECALMYSPVSSVVHYNIGFTYQSLQNYNKAIVHYKISIHGLQVATDRVLTVNVYNCISNVYRTLGMYALALHMLLKARRVLKSADPNIENQLGVTYTEMRRPDLAAQAYAQALKSIKNHVISTDTATLKADILMNCGSLCSWEGNTQKSIDYYNQALLAKPGHVLAFQNKLLGMLYTPSTAKEYEYVYTQHKLINKIMKPVLPAFYFYPRDNGNCKGPIKVGIVSGDFQNHPVSYFIAPFLEGYSPTVFKVTCYTESVVDTTKFRDCVQWKNTQGTTSASLASRIRADAQDILIDLAGHSRHNRLAVFAERAAPVQIEYIGYPCTTGLSAMDYRIVDTTSDPRIDDAEYTQQYTEKLLSLDRCFLCYSVTKTPSLKSESRQGVTFGCFNRLNKVTEEYIAFVNELLTENPTFRFLFKTKGFSSKTVKTAFESRFSPQIRPRVCLMECTVTLEESLEVYNQIDFSVDTFPYNGTTTTCESLSMGVPVFTVRDTKHGFHASNVSASILTHSGLSEYIHDSFTEILSKVKNWPVPDKQSVRTAFLTGNVTNKQDFNTKIQKLLVSVSVSV